MSRFAIIQGGTVANIIESDTAFAESIGAIPAGAGAIGDLYADGVFTKPPAPATPVPQSVTMRQARLALLSMGLLSAVDGAIDGMAEPTKSAARVEWEYSGEVQRSKGLVLSLGSELGLNDAQLDALFVTAATL